MTWRPARSLTVLRDQLNARFPNRSKVSDGIIGDPAHSARQSFHNPDVNGVVRAMDITHDPAKGVDIARITAELAASGDPRIHELIVNGRYWSRAARKWTPYYGSNAHTKHFHISVAASPVGDQTVRWNLPILDPVSTAKLARGATGAKVSALQTVLRAWYPSLNLEVDGVYGPATENGVRHLQARAGLAVTGIADAATLRKLGL